MRNTRFALAAAIAIGSTVAVPGCGESTPPVTKEALTTKTDTSQFSGMMEQMKANVKGDKSGKAQGK